MSTGARELAQSRERLRPRPGDADADGPGCRDAGMLRVHPDGIMELSGEYEQPDQNLPLPTGALLEFAAEEVEEPVAPSQVRRRWRRRSHSSTAGLWRARSRPRWGGLAIGLAVVLVALAAALTSMTPSQDAMVLASPRRVVPAPLELPAIPRLDAQSGVVSLGGEFATSDKAVHARVTQRVPAVVPTSEVLDVVPASPAEMPDATATLAPTELSGWWTATSTTQPTSAGRGGRGPDLGYRLRLEQQGSRIVGHGFRWADAGRSLGPAARPALTVEGQVIGHEVRLAVRERAASGGGVRDSTLSLHLIEDGSLTGRSVSGTPAISRTIVAIRSAGRDGVPGR